MDTLIQSIKDNWKRYLISSGVTFLLGFLLIFAPEIDNISLESIKDGTLAGILFVAFRGGLKLVIEALIGILTGLSKK